MKKEIEFDFAKWGQEGVITLDNKGNAVLNLWAISKPTNEWIYIVEIDNNRMPFYLNKNGANMHSGCIIKMFEEVKPREFWVNIYQGGSINIYESELNARGAYESSMRFAPKIKGETIKVREVLD
jgi:hypothetical protein